jgi:hypothetical protein
VRRAYCTSTTTITAVAVAIPAAVPAAQTGLQEKATFLQAFGKKGVYSSFIALPAMAELLLLATVLLVLWQYTMPAASSTRRQQVEYTPVEVDVHA